MDIHTLQKVNTSIIWLNFKKKKGDVLLGPKPKRDVLASMASKVAKVLMEEGSLIRQEHAPIQEEVQKFSTSIFVTNFPDHAKAKDLWNICKQYGQVVDAFILDRKSKAGKRYGFIQFIRVYDVDHLVSNLCTLWMGSHHLHANVARFQRPPVVNSGGYTHQNGN
nr:ChaC-like family protein [Tanacetum cinerariifolium]